MSKVDIHATSHDKSRFFKCKCGKIIPRVDKVCLECYAEELGAKIDVNHLGTFTDLSSFAR